VSKYIFDHALERERERLGKLSEWLDPGTERYLDAIGVGLGWRVLEVAAGAGSIARVLSERVGPAGTVVATDVDLKFLDDLGLPNVEVRKHDILNDELEENSFDLVHTRLLLMHLPAREEALKRMVAAAKPGGWVFVEDMEMSTWMDITPAPSMGRVREAMFKLFEMAGADPFYGRNLPFVLTEQGLEDVYAEGRTVWGIRENNPGLEQFKLSLIEIKDMLATSGLASVEDIEETLRLIDDPAWYGVPPTVVAAYGRKPA
jgi:SAM-dependent methyltransferase